MPTTRTDVRRLLWRLARRAIEPRDLWARPLDDDSWAELTAVAATERVEGLLTSAVADGAFLVTRRQARACAQIEQSIMLQQAGLSRSLAMVAERLHDAGIEFRVLKGLALRHLDYADPIHRVAGDIDLLVRGADLGRCRAVLADLGRPTPAEWRRSADEARWVKSIVMRLSPGGVEVDLHRTPAPGPYGLRFDPELLFERPRGFSVAGATYPALEKEAAFVHACLNAVINSWYPAVRPVLDLAMTGQELDVLRLRDRLARTRTAPVAHEAIAMIQRHLGVDLPTASQAVADIPISRTDRALHLASCQRLRIQSTQNLLATTVAGHGFDRIRYLVGLSFPPEGFVPPVSFDLRRVRAYRRRSTTTDPRFQR